jgi:hypothetical protein
MVDERRARWRRAGAVVLVAVVGLLGAPLHAPSAAEPMQAEDGGDDGGDGGGDDGGTGITVLPTTTTTAAPTTTETLPPTTETAPPPTAPPTTAPPVTAAPVPTTVRPVPTTVAPVPTTSTTEAETFTTTANLLVAGDGTEGSESTTTTEVGESQVVGTGGIDDNTLVALIIAGLVVVAVAVAVLTWRYWLATRPVPRAPDGPEAADGEAPDDPTTEVPTGSLTPGSGPGSA